jgi:type II protein arginine methyltransferase
MDSLQDAFDHFNAGRIDAAVAAYRAILADDPDNAEANHVLGAILFQQGDTKAAREVLMRAAASPLAPAELHNNLGAVLNALGENEAAYAAFKRAIDINPNYADAYNNLGVAYRDEKRLSDAIGAFQKAVAINPELGHAKANLRAAYRDVVPAWHFAMLDDHERNSDYCAAIERAVLGKRVLDIGTGSGLLAMMAARAGAKSVTTCEVVNLIADKARNIIAVNGLAPRVNVVAKASTEMEIGRDMAERAEILVTETFSSTLLGEDVLPTVEHAHEHLLVPGAAVIPAAASAMGYLAGGEALKAMFFVGRVEGFDLSGFNDFAPPSMGMLLDRFPHETLSGDTELMRFDFRETRFPMRRERVTVTATADGEALGIVQWIRLELDAKTRYENRPSPGADFNGHWTHFFFRFPKPIAVKKGDVVTLNVRHDRRQIIVDVAENPA